MFIGPRGNDRPVLQWSPLSWLESLRRRLLSQYVAALRPGREAFSRPDIGRRGVWSRPAASLAANRRPLHPTRPTRPGRRTLRVDVRVHNQMEGRIRHRALSGCDCEITSCKLPMSAVPRRLTAAAHAFYNPTGTDVGLPGFCYYIRTRYY